MLEKRIDHTLRPFNPRDYCMSPHGPCQVLMLTKYEYDDHSGMQHPTQAVVMFHGRIVGETFDFDQLTKITAPEYWDLIRAQNEPVEDISQNAVADEHES